jgi:hypothetical protein
MSHHLFTVRGSANTASFAPEQARPSRRPSCGLGTRGSFLSQPLRREFDAIQNRWQALSRIGHLPARTDFPPESLTPWMGHIQIVERVCDGHQARHRVRLVGTRIVYYEGRDNTGLFLEDVIPADQREEILAPYRHCAESRAPIYGTFYSCAESAISSQLERLILPLAADGTTIDQFLVAIYRAGT